MAATTSSNPPKKRSIALLLSPVGLVLLSAARLIVVSDYNTTTAVTIASSGGYINAFLGSVIPLVPVFAPYLALALLLFRRFLLSIIVFVFAAFITPAPVSFAGMLRLARSDWQQLVQLAHPFWGSPIIAGFCIVVLSLLVIGPLWSYHREIAEVAGVVVVITVVAAILLTKPSHRGPVPVRVPARVPLLVPVPLRVPRPLPVPAPLRMASLSESRGEQQFIALFTAHLPIAIAICISIVFLVANYSSLGRFLSTVIAVTATVVLFPYVSTIYPFPPHSSYYSGVLHELWLPAEKIVLNSGHVDYGYILASDIKWDTVLLTSRQIVYLHVDDVVRRSVCQPRTTPQPAPYPPLIPLLYTKPAPTPPCASTPRPYTTIPSIVSEGQSLKAISLMLHTWPWHIIAITNALERDRLSAVLSAYESKHNWEAHSPKGQRFWYYSYGAR